MKTKLLLMAGVLLLASAVVFAQSGTYGSPGQQSNTPSAQSTTNPSSSQSTATTPSDNTGATSQQTTGTTANNTVPNGKQKTVEGCILRQSTYFFLQPAHGKMIRLEPGTNDLNAHVGHKVRIHGTEQNAPANTAGLSSGSNVNPQNGENAAITNQTAVTGQTSNPNATPGSTANAGGTTGAVDQSSTNPNPGASSSGAIAGSTGQTSSNGGVATENNNVSNKEVVVDRVDMISETCPANAQGAAQPY